MNYTTSRQNLINCGDDELGRFILAEIFDHLTNVEKKNPATIDSGDLVTGLSAAYYRMELTWIEDAYNRVLTVLEKRHIPLQPLYDNLCNYLYQFQNDITLDGMSDPEVEEVAWAIAYAKWLTLKYNQNPRAKRTPPFVVGFGISWDKLNSWLSEGRPKETTGTQLGLWEGF
jgi:hypothetical protein